MKLFTLFLMAVVSLPSMAQYKKMPRVNTTDERGAMTLVQKAFPTQHDIKIKKKVNANIPQGYASVTLTTHDIWHNYDGTGYQMLLDADANTYGRIIPEKGNLTEYGNAPAGVYDEFEYKIPENADGDISTSNVLKNGSKTILIPAGVYDWCITNPTPSQNFSKIYIASEYGNIGGRAEHYLFINGLEYEFDITLGENGFDQTNVDIRGLDLTYDVNNITYNSADVNWEVKGPFSLYSINLRYRKVNEKYVLDYESPEAFATLEKWDADEDGVNWKYEETGDAHSGRGVWASYSFDEGRYEPINPDNWLLMPKMDLKGKVLSFCARSKKKEFKDNFGVFFLPDGKERILENLEELGVYTDIPNEWTEYTIDLTNLGEGQVVFRHFDSRDRWALYIDDVTIYDQNAVYHPEQYNWITFSKVMDHPHFLFGLESGTKYEMQMRVEPADWGESVFFTTFDCLELEDNADNSTVLNDNQEFSGYVKLNGRTLYKDGSWNTLCLPFDFTLSGSFLDSDEVELMTLGGASFEEGVLYLDFVNADEIKAGVPYIIRWNDMGNHIVNPAFKIDHVSLDENAFTNSAISFKGMYSPYEITTASKKLLYMGKENNMYYPSAAMNIGAFHAYFEMGENLVISTIGDVSGDLNIDISDVVELVNYILNPGNYRIITENADLNGDGNIDISDVVALVNMILSGDNIIVNAIVTNIDDNTIIIDGGKGPAR